MLLQSMLAGFRRGQLPKKHQEIILLDKAKRKLVLTNDPPSKRPPTELCLSEDAFELLLSWASLTTSSTPRIRRIEWLLDRGADISRGRFLHHAAGEGDLDAVKLFVSRNASLVNARNALGRAPLHLAALNRETSVAEFLLDSGADVNAKDLCGRTVLHYASSGSQPEPSEANELIALLKERGADLMAKDNEGGNEYFNRAAKTGDLDEVKELIGRGADVNGVSCNGDLPLLCASENGHADVVQLLLDEGANVDGEMLPRPFDFPTFQVADKRLWIFNNNALHYACEYIKVSTGEDGRQCARVDTEAIELLIRRGSQLLSKKNFAGFLPFQLLFDKLESIDKSGKLDVNILKMSMMYEPRLETDKILKVKVPLIDMWG